MGDSAVICRCHMDGKTSMVMRLDRAIREYLGIADRDVIVFRLVVVQNKRMILGEKLPLWKLAQFKAPPVAPAPGSDGKG